MLTYILWIIINGIVGNKRALISCLITIAYGKPVYIVDIFFSILKLTNERNKKCRKKNLR